MNLLNVLTRLYGKLHNYPGIPFWVLTPFRRVIRGVANVFLPQILKRSPQNYTLNGNKIIVSFTSFPSRIQNVWQVVQCMVNQTLQPHMILLWLSKEQFPTEDSIPQHLRKMENEVFQIRVVDDDIRSHKKYYYVSKEFPNELVFLIDDDLYYPTDILEKSYKFYINHGDCIVANYGYRIQYNTNGSHLNYSKWEQVYKGAEGYNLFFGSGGGTLFKPSSLSNDLINIDKAMELTPFADDIWLNTMAKLSNVRIHILPSGGLLPIKSAPVTLSSINNGERQNDVQIKKVEEVYGRIFDKLYYHD